MRRFQKDHGTCGVLERILAFCQVPSGVIDMFVDVAKCDLLNMKPLSMNSIDSKQLLRSGTIAN